MEDHKGKINSNWVTGSIRELNDYFTYKKVENTTDITDRLIKEGMSELKPDYFTLDGQKYKREIKVYKVIRSKNKWDAAGRENKAFIRLEGKVYDENNNSILNDRMARRTQNFITRAFDYKKLTRKGALRKTIIEYKKLLKGEVEKKL